MKYKALGLLVIFLCLLLGTYTSGALLSSFIDLPSIIMILGMIAGCMMAKHGVKGLWPYGQEKSIRNQMARDGGIIAITSGVTCSILGLIIMLNNLSDPQALGPAMAVSFLTSFYGLIIHLVFFFPFIDNDGKSSSNIGLHQHLSITGPLILLSLVTHSICFMFLSFGGVA